MEIYIRRTNEKKKKNEEFLYIHLWDSRIGATITLEMMYDSFFQLWPINFYKK